MKMPPTRKETSAPSLLGAVLYVIALLCCGNSALAQDYSKPLVKYGIGALNCATLTPDETQLVTGGADGNVRFWSAGSGQLLRTLACDETGVLGLAFSSDGKRLLTGCDEGLARLWDTASGRLLLTIKGDIYIQNVEITPDGKKLLTGNNAVAWVWDAATGSLLRRIAINPAFAKPTPRPTGSPSKISSFADHEYYTSETAFSPDGTLLAGHSEAPENYLRLWNTGTGQLLPAFSGNTVAIETVEFFPDSRKVIGGCRDQTIRVWDVATGQLLKTIACPTSLTVGGVAMSPDGQRIAAINRADVPAKIWVWDAASGQLLKEWIGHEDPIYSVGFTKDSKRLLTCGMDQTVRVWDATSGQALHTYTGHNGPIVGYGKTVAISRDGKRVLTGHTDRKARLWDAQSGQLLRTLSGFRELVRFVGFSADGKTLLSCDRTEARISDAASGQTLRSNTFTSSGAEIYLSEISGDGKRVLATYGDLGIREMELDSGRTLRSFSTLTGQGGDGHYSADGKWILTSSMPLQSNASWLPTVRVFDAQSGACVGRYDQHASDIVVSMDITADGKKVMAASWGNLVRVYDSTKTNPLLITWYGPYYDILSVAFAPDGRRALIGTLAGPTYHALLWNPANGSILARLPHPSHVYSAVFSADGQRALTGCWDGAARLWDVSCGARGWGRYE